MMSDDYQSCFDSAELPSFSVVTCFNDCEALEANLLKSLKEQRSSVFEFIAVDNTCKAFLSVPSALNYGGGKAKGDYIMFVHQDVYLCGASWINNALNLLQKVPGLGAAGVAGVDHNNNYAGFISDRGRLFGKPFDSLIPVQTLDEQLIIVPRKVYEKTKFDESFRFHSYVADYCLILQEMNQLVCVLPMFVEHNSLSVAVRQASDIREDALLLKKHHDHFKLIFKTTGVVGSQSSSLRKSLIGLSSNLFWVMSQISLKKWKIVLGGKFVLDVGCVPFEQQYQKKLLSQNAFNIGVSPKKRYLLVSKKLGIHQDYVVADLEALPFKEKGVAFAFVNGVLEYS